MRGGRQHPLFARVAEACAPPAWVIAAQPERGVQACTLGFETGYVNACHKAKAALLALPFFHTYFLVSFNFT